MINLFWKLLGWQQYSVTMRKMGYCAETNQLEPSRLRVRYWTRIGDSAAAFEFQDRVSAFKADGWEEER